MRYSATLLLVSLGSFVGCAREQAPLPEQGVYAGYYLRGFEVSSFRPQGSADEWWVSWVNPEAMPHQQIGYIAVRGSVTNVGRHGHLGGYSRELTVAEVIEFRPLSEAERSVGE